MQPLHSISPSHPEISDLAKRMISGFYHTYSGLHEIQIKDNIVYYINGNYTVRGPIVFFTLGQEENSGMSSWGSEIKHGNAVNKFSWDIVEVINN